jgi:hypothetical protein
MITTGNAFKEKIPEKLVHLFQQEEKDTKEVKIPPRQAVKTSLMGRDQDIKKLQELILKMRDTGSKKVITKP